MSDYLDRYGRRGSICHRMPNCAKLTLAFAVVVFGVSVPAEYWPLHGVLAVLAFVGHSFAGIPLSYLFRRLSVFAPLITLFAVSLPAVHGFTAGWDLMISIILRSTVSFVTLLWLVNVMPFDQLLCTLRRLHVPDVLTSALAFMYRYLFVLWDELDRMTTARRARTFGKASRPTRWKSSAQLIGMLVIRSMTRAERVHAAMLARGWDGRIRSLDDAQR